MHKLPQSNEALLNDFIDAVDQWLDASAGVEKTREDLIAELNILPVNDYARRVRSLGYYSVAEHHDYMMRQMSVMLTHVVNAAGFYRNLKARFDAAYNYRPIPVKMRAYLEQQLLDENIAEAEKEYARLVQLHETFNVFDEPIKLLREHIAEAKSRVISYTDNKTGHVFFGKTQSDDSHDTVSACVGINQFITASEKKS